MLVMNLFEELTLIKFLQILEISLKRTDLLVNKVKIKNMHWLNDEIVQRDF
jgi:hypothetical protein